MSEPLPLFLFLGMGGYDPQLVEVGIACGDAVTTVQIAYPAWRVLYDMRDFEILELAGFTAAMLQGDALNKIAYMTARHLKSPRWNLLLRLYARIPRRWLGGNSGSTSNATCCRNTWGRCCAHGWRAAAP